MKPLLSLKKISIHYKKNTPIFKKKEYFEALKSITLDIFPGETLGIIGRNGAGKSTLLRVISGIIKPNSGKIINDGASISLLSLQAGFDDNLCGRDNTVLTGMMHGFRRKEIEEQLEKIIHYSELEEFFHEPVRTYSAGMRARLAFSISTIFSPDILLIDEVLAVGDSRFRKKAELTMIQKIRSQQTIIMVTHSQQQILRLCDRAILIENGISIADGLPEKIIHLYNELAD